MHVTVQDLLGPLSSAGADHSALPPSIASRITFQPHDFFESQPHSISAPADAFFLRKILHDWPLQEAQQILGHVSAALGPGAVVVVMDTVLPPPGDGTASLVEARLRARNLTMMQAFNSGEREMREWLELLEGVRPRLRLVEYTQPTGSFMAVLTLERG